MNIESLSNRGSVVRLSGTHGYLIDGDRALLNAELDFRAGIAEEQQLTLQLWACAEPYAGGPIQGVKVAEAPLEPSGEGRTLNAEAPARLPALRGDYSMVLVVASGAPGTLEQVHDFSNFPARVAFELPSLQGAVGYAMQETHAVLRAERIENPRSPTNLSGSLTLELWALRETYTGGALDGFRLGCAELERIAGQQCLENVERTVELSAPPAGRWQIALVLREWAQDGYVTRDFRNFTVPYEVKEAGPVKVSVQTASVEQLEQVEGIDRKLAKAIVKARPFSSLNDLLRVRGIGEKLLRKLRPALSI